MTLLDFDYIGNLVIRAQKNDTNAFAELYALTYQKEYRFACNYLKDPQLAQDALQETYISVLKNIRCIKEPRLFVSWLHSINFRICYDFMARNKRDAYTSYDEHFENVPDDNTAHNPEQALIRRQNKAELIKFLQQLPEKEAQAIRLRYFKKMALEDIAQAMDCSLSSVKRYLLNGKKALEKSMKGGSSL